MPSAKQAQDRLDTHLQDIRSLHMRDMFSHNPGRGERYTLHLDNIHVDYSKNIITDTTLELLIEFAHARDMKDKIQSMFNGDRINLTENRAALHTALRAKTGSVVAVDGKNIAPGILEQLDKIKNLANTIHSGEYRGWTGKPIDTFVNIGAGGSDLGPKLVVDALRDFRHGDTRSFFIANIDYQQLAELQENIDPETSLFIVSSKSFATLETNTNAASLQKWMRQLGCTAINRHFIAVSSNSKSAMEFGIAPANIFSTWNWVGGRFSLWSATGIPAALALGFDNFRKLLDGAASMDCHFMNNEFSENIPVILGLLDFWYSNFFAADTHAFIPYDESLRLLPEYLAQLFMESNGKSVDIHNNPVDYQTTPVIWGATGTNSQHTFFQLLHQGTKLVPVDFLAPLSKPGNKNHHALLLANCIAQSQALMQGEESSTAYNYFPGNKPSNTILYSALTPATLGALLAMFEHRAFVQGILWNINPFDQWGVELGKKLALDVCQHMTGNTTDSSMDASTRNLIRLYKNELKQKM